MAKTADTGAHSAPDTPTSDGNDPSEASRRTSNKVPDPRLLARLARLGVVKGGAGKDLRRAGVRPPALGIETVVPGRWTESELGRCYISWVRRSVADLHGDERLGEALDVDVATLSKLTRDDSVQALDVSRTAFVDTETTGLAGGAGTYAFLIGVGVFDGRSFKVGQFFMDDPSQERAQLAAAEELLRACTAVVTFNGRTFDMPLLRTRYRLHGMAPPLAAAPHVDLLPLSRRIWRRRLTSCTLGSLEENVLGVERADDVPGAFIPPRYFAYQRDGDARPLAPIFKHNAVDILSMVSLLSLAARVYGEPDRALEHGQDWLSLAHTYSIDGDHGRAIAACDTALSAGLSDSEADEARLCMTLAAKRSGDWGRATAVWEQMAEESRRLFPFVELAKYHEHRDPSRDLSRALEWATQGRSHVTSGAIRPKRPKRNTLEELEYRIARLERRLERMS